MQFHCYNNLYVLPCCAPQTVAHARMEQQLYGSSSRTREDDSRVINTKQRSLGSTSGADDPSGRRGGGRSSTDGRSNGTSGSGGPKPNNRSDSEQRQGLRGLFFNILRNRFDSSSGGANSQSNNRGSSSGGDDADLLDGLVRREGSMHLPRPADCQVQGTHSDMCIVRVRRHHLVEDALDEIARQYRYCSTSDAAPAHVCVYTCMHSLCAPPLVSSCITGPANRHDCAPPPRPASGATSSSHCACTLLARTALTLVVSRRNSSSCSSASCCPLIMACWCSSLRVTPTGATLQCQVASSTRHCTDSQPAVI